MKHTCLLPILKIRITLYKDRRRLLLGGKLLFSLVILVFASADYLRAQKPLTGSGSSSCNDIFKIGPLEDIDGSIEGQTNSSLYNDDVLTGKQQYIACPDDENIRLVKVAFTQFEVARFDTITIYEGCGTSGPTLSGFPYYGGGASAANDLPGGSWYQADCDSDDGCLTIVFAPNGDNNKSNGIIFDVSCEDRPIELTCPTDASIPSVCNLNNADGVAALYVIPPPTATCSYELSNLPTVTIDSAGTNVTAMAMPNTGGSTALTNNFEYINSDGNTALSVGDTIYLLMGFYNFSYTYTFGAASSTCNFKVRVDDISPVCNDQINIGLSAGSCSLLIEPDMLIEGDGCNEGFTVNILEGANKGTNILTHQSVGDLVRVEVVTPFGNRCWGRVLVEDKAGPLFTCRDTAMFCGIDINDNIAALQPTDGIDCTDFTFEVVTNQAISYQCATTRVGVNNAPDTIGIVEVAWTAVDIFGNRSNVCIQKIYQLRPEITVADIIWPEDTLLYGCYKDISMNSVAVTGVPSFEINNDTIPLRATCLFGIDQKDFDFTTTCDGHKKIGRVWTLVDWCGNGSGPAFFQSDTQYIQVLDTLPPILGNLPSTLTISGEHGACSAHVIFPRITVKDGCHFTTNYRIEGPAGTVYHTAGSIHPDTMRNVPYGAHEFTYVGEDDCGNQTKHTLPFEITDAINPTAIVDQRSNIALTNDVNQTWVYATSFDNGSTDNCWIAKILARRLDQPDAEPTEAVGFTCDDLDKTIMIEVTVIDEQGNIAINMTEVVVVDKVGVCKCSLSASITTTETSGYQNDNTICSTESATLKATLIGGTPPFTYQWSGLNGGATGHTVTVKPPIATTYGVTITDSKGCTGIAFKEVKVTGLPKLTTDPIPVICPNTTINITPSGIGNYAYTWSVDSNRSNVVTNILTISPEETTRYYVTITDKSNNCTIKDSKVVEVVPKIKVITTTSPANPHKGQESTINVAIANGPANPDYQYSWTGPFPLTNPYLPTTTFIPTAEGTFTFTIQITDKNSNCTTEAPASFIATALPMASLSGRIYTELGIEVEQAVINLEGYEMPPAITGARGQYEFIEVPMQGSYQVIPENSSNPLNGVSTFDLVLLSKHILGINELDSPYKLIAADINRSGTITAFDMVQLRKLILNEATEFPNNTSWRFIDAAYEFTNPTNPLGEAIPETYEITELDTDMNWLDFIAVKIGDLNDSATPNNLVAANSRSHTGTFWLDTQQELHEDGETLVYHFSSAQLKELVGYQFTLQFDPTMLAFDRVISTDWVGEEHFGTTQTDRGILTSSWNIREEMDLLEEETIFSLAFTLKGNYTNDELLAINSNTLQAEAYQASGELLEVRLNSEAVVPEVATDQLELYQNRPNPFTGKTTIGFYLPTSTTAIMRIFNTDGSLIKVYQGTYEKGYNELIIDSSDLTHYGALYYQLATPKQIATRKMIYTR